MTSCVRRGDAAQRCGKRAALFLIACGHAVGDRPGRPRLLRCLSHDAVLRRARVAMAAGGVASCGCACGARLGCPLGGGSRAAGVEGVRPRADDGECASRWVAVAGAGPPAPLEALPDVVFVNMSGVCARL